MQIKMLNVIPNVTLLHALIKDAQTTAEKAINPLIKGVEAKYSDQGTTHTEYAPEDKRQIHAEYVRLFNENIDAKLLSQVKDLELMLLSPAWAFLMDIIKAQDSGLEDYPFSTYTEKMAYQGHRTQVIADVIKLPEQVIEYYKALKSTQI